jgi:hypothetical protein
MPFIAKSSAIEGPNQKLPSTFCMFIQLDLLALNMKILKIDDGVGSTNYDY